MATVKCMGDHRARWRKDTFKSISSCSKSTPWASGRVLTEQQRARKREVDRIAQRQRRQNNESRIEEAETKLECLAAQLKSLKDKTGGVGQTPSALENVMDLGHGTIQDCVLQ
jgi:hypothetical protein